MDSQDIDAGRERWQFRYDDAVAAGRVRDADFTTLSGVEVDPVYGPPEGENVPGFERIGWPGSTPSHAAFMRRDTAESRGRSGNSLALETQNRPMSATR